MSCLSALYLQQPLGDYDSSAYTTHSASGKLSGEDWQLDFTQLLTCRGFKYLLVLIDTFTKWVEAFPTQTERTQEVSKQLLK